MVSKVMQSLQSVKPFCLIYLVLLLPGVISGEDLLSKTKQVRDQATVTYKSRHRVDCDKALVETALVNPLVMGALWTAYGYAPFYRISKSKVLDGDGSWPIHIQDPTGIVGDIWEIKGEEGHHTYLAEGKLDHWAVPALNEGTAVFDMKIRSVGAVTEVTIEVFVMPDSRVAEAVVWMLSPIIKARIENRVTLNFQDVARILKDIADKPEAVVTRIEGNLRKDFERIF